MAAGKDLTTDADIEAALDRASKEPPEPLATAAEYSPVYDIVVIRLDNGRRLVIPREEMQGLEGATETQLRDIQIFGGVDIAWPQLDVDHYLPHLLEGNFATEQWKQARQKHTAAA